MTWSGYLRGACSKCESGTPCLADVGIGDTHTSAVPLRGVAVSSHMLGTSHTFRLDTEGRAFDELERLLFLHTGPFEFRARVHDNGIDAVTTVRVESGGIESRGDWLYLGNVLRSGDATPASEVNND